MSAQLQRQTAGFTIGICASGRASQLPTLLPFLRNEEYGQGFSLLRIVVIASGCPDSVLASIRGLVRSDKRILLLEEPERRGKAEAINRIMEHSTGDYLVMLNADAFPDENSIRKLLAIVSNPRVGAASASPILDEGNGVLRNSLALMWSAHSQMSLLLNHAGISNHACDELIVIRRSLVPRLPPNLVNDGAYMGGLVRARGYLVKFSNTARVRIEVPRVPIDMIRQRRRIIFGHVQVWRSLGRPPRTIESMLFIDPLVSFRTLVRTLSERPWLVAALPVVLVGESISTLLGLYDTARSTDRHKVWRRNAE